MRVTDRLRLMHPTTPLVVASAAFVLAGGAIHLREWLDLYRHVPADAPGAGVVRAGFPLNTATSLAVATALLLCAWRRSRYLPHVVIGAAVFQAGALAALIISRTGSLFGWSEPGWTAGADQSRAVEVGALLALAGVLAITAHQRRRLARQLSPTPARVRQ